MRITSLERKKVLYTGGNGKLANQLKTVKTSLDISYPSKAECNLLSIDSIQAYTNKNSEFDIVITGANQFPGIIEHFNCESFNLPAKHLVLIEKLKTKPKYFINLTSALHQTYAKKNDEEHYLYRAQKGYAEDLYVRYFRLKHNKETHFINLYPGHIDDEILRNTIAIKFVEMLENIESYKENQYIFEEQSKSMINFRLA